MSTRSGGPLPRRAEPTPIDSGAAENLRYIRNTIEAAHRFTTVPGKGCIAIGIVGLVAAGLEASGTAGERWLTIWLVAALAACAVAAVTVAGKARAQGLSLQRTAARRFFLTLAPSFVAGAVLTIALADAVPRETVAALWLLLYGAGLAASGIFAIQAVTTAGIAFMALGAATLVLPAGSAPTMLALGFGGVHVVLGEIVRRNHGG